MVVKNAVDYGTPTRERAVCAMDLDSNSMFGTIGLPELIVVFIICVGLLLPIWMCGRVAQKAGFSAWWGLAFVVPLVGFVLIWVFAFVAWPIERSRPA